MILFKPLLLSNTYLDWSIIYVLPGIVHLMSGVTHMENDLLFCCLQIEKL